jgi:hypothetical protein
VCGEKSVSAGFAEHFDGVGDYRVVSLDMPVAVSPTDILVSHHLAIIAPLPDASFQNGSFRGATVGDQMTAMGSVAAKDHLRLV